MQTTRFSVGALMVMSLIITGCLCRPQDSNSKSLKESVPGGAKPLESVTGPTIPSSRMDRLQKPSQVLNMGFDEIVVESNLQVHNRVGSKNKSKIMLPSNSTATPMQTNKSARSLLV
ncbi:uncharacterized protein LOC132917565 [Rhopalosiphum padi]|uniref:uncharacterized protein LOC132917565 n=1 Tax=Rhopalosiphum padi TaxID=40932 RepID=UPI00298DF7AA|nr:uncharacterized protein LOC132917565 [Rhopalosiphum padi]